MVLRSVLFKAHTNIELKLMHSVPKIKWEICVHLMHAYLLSTVGVSSTLLVVAISASVEPSANKGEKNCEVAKP